MRGDPVWPLAEPAGPCCGSQTWSFQLLPDGLIYRNYLAGRKESRFASHWVHDPDEGAIWDITLGGRAGIFRYGTHDPISPEGWQLDIEGAAFPRLDPSEDQDLVVCDYRFGVPLSYRSGIYESKLAFYHLSSHLGDEFMLKNPGFRRINYSRDVIVWGHALRPFDDWRTYFEVGVAVRAVGGADPVELQFGIEYSPLRRTGLRGAPFAAANAHLRQEVNFGGHVTVQAGWQWRSDASSHLYRIGLDYTNGESTQWELLGFNEQQIGLGMWYDF